MCVLVVYEYLVFFFFQAEDGIRDLVRSRGLGDVYKRQSQRRAQPGVDGGGNRLLADTRQRFLSVPAASPDPVSYTHLTLPTSDLV